MTTTLLNVVQQFQNLQFYDSLISKYKILDNLQTNDIRIKRPTEQQCNAYDIYLAFGRYRHM